MGVITRAGGMQSTQNNRHLFAIAEKPDDHQTALLRETFPEFVRDGLVKRSQWEEARMLGLQRMSLLNHLDQEICAAAKEGKLPRTLVAEVRRERDLHARFLLSKVLAHKARGTLEFLVRSDEQSS